MDDVHIETVQKGDKNPRIILLGKMRSILCVTQQLLLDGWNDLHETLGV